MELNREKIIKALERDIRLSIDLNYECPRITYSKLRYALSLINSQEQRIKELTEEVESLKQAMEHEHASFMEIFGQYGEKCDRLTEENERLVTALANYDRQTEVRIAEEYYTAEAYEELREENERLSGAVKQYEEERKYHFEMSRTRIAEAKADTVREMQERLKQRKVCYGNITFKVVQIDEIDQIAKEMLEGELK